MKKIHSLLILSLFFCLSFLKGQIINFNPTTKILRMRSEHFEVLFPEGYEEIAGKSIIIGEKKFKDLSKFFNWTPQNKIILGVFPNFDEANGFTIVSPYKFIALIPFPPSSDSEINNYDEWLNLLLTHELSHIFHLDQSRDLAKFFRTIFGNAPVSLVFPQLSNSIAFTEGIAVYSESINTDAGRLNSSGYLAYIKNNVLFDNFPPFDRIYGGTKFFPGMNSSYIYGSFMIDYISKTKKWKNLKKAINISSKIPIIYAPELAVLMLTDHMPWTHYKLMKKYYKKRFKDPELNISQISKNGFRKRELKSYKNHLYYIKQTPFNMAGIAKFDIKTGKTEILFERYQIKNFSIDKKNGRIFFSAINKINNYYYFSDLYLYDFKRKKIHRLSKGKRLYYPLYYKNGFVLAVQKENAGSRIILYDFNSKKTIKKYDGFDQISFPVLDKTMEHLYFAAHKNYNWDIYAIEIKSGEISRITNSSSIEKYLNFKNNKLYFVSQSKEEQSVFSYDTENKIFHKIFTSPTDIRGFTFINNSLYLLSLYKDGVEIVRPYKTESVEIKNYNGYEEPQSEDYKQKLKYKIEKANLLKYCLPKFWLPSYKEVDGRYLLGPSTFSFDPYGRNFFSGGIYYNYKASKYPSIEARLYHYFWYLPLNLEYIDTSSQNGTLGDYRDLTLKIGTFYQIGDYYKRLRLSTNYIYEARKKTKYKYTLSGFSLNLNFDSTKSFPFSISREDGVLFSVGYRKNLRVLGSDLNLNEIFTDLRAYIQGAYPNQVLALKIGYYKSFGDGIKIIGVGGDKSYEYYPSIFNPSVSLQRGYDSSSFYGNKIFSFSGELRNPIVRIERGVKFYPIFLSQIYSSIFVDWSKVEWEGKGVNTLLSMGAEMSFDLRIHYNLNLTLTGGIAFSSSVEKPVKPRYYFRIGKSF